MIMNRIIILFLLLTIAWPGEGFAQKKEKRKKIKNDAEAIVPESFDKTEITNLFIDATQARLSGNNAKAISLYESCLSKYPQHSASMYEMAQIYYETGDYTSAAKYASQASGIEKDNKWYKLLLVEIYGKAGMKKELLETCENLVKQDPNSADYLYELANAYLMNNDGNAAIKTYNKIEEIIGVTEEISLQKQRIYLIQRKTDQAAEEILKLKKEFPDEEIRYLSILAEMYMQAGKPDLAVDYYQQILARDPQNPYIHITLSDYYRQKGNNEKSFEELKIGFANPSLEIDTKIRILLTYISVNEMYVEYKADITELAQILVKTHLGDPKAHSLYGDLLSDDKKYAEARAEYRKVIAIDSSRYVVWESLLNCDIQLADYKAVAEESIRAIELFPLLPVPYLFKGVAHLENKQLDEAINSFNAGVKLVSGNNALLAQFYTYLGDTYYRNKNNRLSDENYEKALKIDPNNSYVLNNYAYYLSLRNENLQKAEEMAAKSVKLDSNNPANMDTYGWVLYKLGRYNEAADWVKKSIENSEKPDADLLEHLGDIYYKQGNIENALIQWQNAQKAGGGSEFLDKKIKDKKLYE